MTTTRIPVTGATPEANYHVLVGNGLLGHLGEVLGQRVKKVLVIHPQALEANGQVVVEQLQADGYQVYQAVIPDAEEGKRLEVAGFCWQALGQADFTRSDAIVSVGGGAVTDLAGFVAATWLRGIRVVHVPTTFLGMVDAAVGGKTGINTAEGKNLVGAFHPPAAVLCDLDALSTLPVNELLTGMAETVKCGFIADPVILDLIEQHPQEAKDPGSAVLRELVERSVRVKAEVVSADLKESGRREFLNYGHTLGHAIENNERYQWRHGAAVAIGMIFAAELGRTAGTLSEDVVERHHRILNLLGLPTEYRYDQWPKLLEVMKRDKKTRGGLLRFVVLDDVARPRIMEVPDPSVLFAVYQELVH
ncbi:MULTISPECIES: 3-dehydroquinate synthase [Kocuria]|uniref:3-dehydroquinate synthase n=1 Tax=Kocuria subflava TaxID=1736139 RepID=A0A846THS6_9MICC|nr:MULTISPECIES: 3-dehydroquinate synthase [Kocuria]NKE08718.1 3-dehydroquinate synthase [Kocuria subflava]